MDIVIAAKLSKQKETLLTFFSFILFSRAFFTQAGPIGWSSSQAAHNSIILGFSEKREKLRWDWCKKLSKATNTLGILRPPSVPFLIRSAGRCHSSLYHCQFSRIHFFTVTFSFRPFPHNSFVSQSLSSQSFLTVLVFTVPLPPQTLCWQFWISQSLLSQSLSSQSFLSESFISESFFSDVDADPLKVFEV